MSNATTTTNGKIKMHHGESRLPKWLGIFRSARGLLCMFILIVMIAFAVCSLFGLSPYDPAAQNITESLQGPSGSHWFGTDQFGRDIFVRTSAGLVNSLRISLISVAVSGFIGIALGAMGGFFGGWLDRIVGVMTNVLFAFPSLLLALALAATLQRNWLTVAVAISIAYTPIFIRVARGPAMSLRSADYVQASAAIGRRSLWTMACHVIPNMSGILVVQITLSLSWAILTEASLSFLGFGTPPPAPSLGSMVYDAQTLSSVAPWMLFFPGVILILTVIGINLLGELLQQRHEHNA